MSKKRGRRSHDDLPPLAMPDVEPEDALRGFMQVDPEKVKEAEKRERQEREEREKDDG